MSVDRSVKILWRERSPKNDDPIGLWDETWFTDSKFERIWSNTHTDDNDDDDDDNNNDDNDNNNNDNNNDDNNNNNLT